MAMLGQVVQKPRRRVPKNGGMRGKDLRNVRFSRRRSGLRGNGERRFGFVPYEAVRHPKALLLSINCQGTNTYFLLYFFSAAAQCFRL